MNIVYLIFHVFCLPAIHTLNWFQHDEQNFTMERPKRQADCSSDSFKCINGQCIDNFSVCDGAKDCKDGSDETLSVCSKLSLQCKDFAFRCAYGACVDRDKKCNGIQDCADNSDELLPECKMVASSVAAQDLPACKPREFRCLSGDCIEEFSVCDGTPDCIDGSDETITQCVNMKCPKYSWQCAYGGCIDQEKKCNKVKDCADGSDEDPELCKKPTRPVVRPPPKTTVSPPIGKCHLPNKPEGGSFIISGCRPNDKSSRCHAATGSPTDSNTILIFNCSKGYALQGTEATKAYSYCIEGEWEPKPPICLPLCKKLLSSSLDITCIYRGENISCENELRPGTKAQPKCKEAYHIENPSTAFHETICLLNGEWESPLFRCAPECGQPHSKNVKPLISYAIPTTYGDYPWHAGLYLQEDGIWDMICGGTIISPHIILTAAHCIYMENLGRARDVNEIKVVVGKYNRHWNIQDPNQQTRDVREIVFPLKYRGRSSSYAQDIALLDLVANIILSNVVLPACIDKGVEGFLSPHKNVLGYVAGWGFTENRTKSAELLSAHLPYLDYDSCRKEVPNNFLPFITYDKFCAGYKNGTGVQQGDSGGGLTFIKHNLHFVYGIVSVKPIDRDTYATFTNVSEHIVWLENAISALKRKHLQ